MTTFNGQTLDQTYGDPQPQTQKPPATGPVYEMLNGMHGYRMPDGGWRPGDNPVANAAGGAYINPNAGSGATPGAPGAPPPTAPGAPGGPPAQNNTTSEFQNAWRNEIQQRMTQKPTVDMNDPVIKGQTDVYNQQVDNARRERQMAMSERLGARGLEDSGYADADVASSYDEAGRAKAGFASTLAAQELTVKRQEISDALESGRVSLESDLGRQLQRELAQIDAQLRREGYGVQERLGSSDIALRDKLGMGALNIDLERLRQGADQFNKNLGFQIGDREAYWNNSAISQLLR